MKIDSFSDSRSYSFSVVSCVDVLGTFIEADLLHLREIERMTSGVLSIGGAGVFDAIALCGLFALLLTERMTCHDRQIPIE